MPRRTPALSVVGSTSLVASVLLTGAALLFSSCTERTAPEPALPPEFSNAPSPQSGIFRFEDFFAALVFDFKSGLVAVIGLTSSIPDFCEGLGGFQLANFQLKPHQMDEINSLIKSGNMSVQVLPIPATLVGDFCTDFGAAPLLYSGVGKLTRTDNNFTPTGTQGRRADAFGFTINGALTDVATGGRVQFSGALRQLILPSDEFREVMAAVRVTR